MLQIQNLAPPVYYNHSRDFQLIGHLYELILNSAKTNSEILYNLPFNENIDTKLLDLVTSTLGFKSLHNYNIQALVAACTTFTELLRNKGTEQGMDLLVTTLVAAEGLDTRTDISHIIEGNIVTIFVPLEFRSIALLRDLLDYILPAGMSYKVNRHVNIQKNQKTTIISKDRLLVAKVPNIDPANYLIPDTLLSVITDNPGSWDDTVDDLRTMQGKLYNSTIASAERPMSDNTISWIVDNNENEENND